MISRSGALLLALAVLAPAAVGQSKEAAKSKDVSKQSVTKDQTATLYREGLAHERKGNYRAALGLYLEAGEAGYGLAQKRLAETYDRGNAVVNRDYQTALYWYEKARIQGIEVPKPLPPIKGR